MPWTFAAFAFIAALVAAFATGAQAASPELWAKCGYYKVDACNQILASKETLKDQAIAFNYRGIAYLYSKIPNRAIADFTRAIELDPKFVEARINRVTAYKDRGDKGDYEIAIGDLTRLIGLGVEPGRIRWEDAYSLHRIDNEAALYALRGQVYVKASQLDLARADLEKSLQLEPGNIEAKMGLHEIAQAEALTPGQPAIEVTPPQTPAVAAVEPAKPIVEATSAAATPPAPPAQQAAASQPSQHADERPILPEAPTTGRLEKPSDSHTKKWSELDLRGLTPGMTVSQVRDMIKKEWPDARVNDQVDRVEVGGEVFQYDRNVNFSVNTGDEQENITLDFMAPPSVADGPEKATLIRIGRAVRRDAKPLLRDALLDSLNNKYGPPSIVATNHVQWNFDSNQHFLSKETLATLEQTKKKECDDLRNKAYAQAAQAITSGGTVRSMDQEIQKCTKDHQMILNCTKITDRTLCPYSLNVQWLNGASQTFVKWYGADLYGVPYDQEVKDRRDNIQKELEKRAEEKARTSAGAHTNL